MFSNTVIELYFCVVPNALGLHLICLEIKQYLAKKGRPSLYHKPPLCDTTTGHAVVENQLLKTVVSTLF